MIVLAFALAAAPDAVPVPEDRPSEPAPEASAPEPEPPPPAPVERREGELFGPPYGSRVGEKREGEVWRPIEPQTYAETQPVPSEEAVTDQPNAELQEAIKKKAEQPPLESKQRFALEVKFGPYLAEVDRNWSGPGYGPYAKVFGRIDEDTGVTIGEPKSSFYGGIAFEWQITKKLAGPIGIGVQWTMARDSAFAPLAEPPAEGFTRSRADEVKFTVMPLALQAVYRFELLADKVRWAPFVPFVKAGVAYGFWWTKNGDGKIAVVKAGDEVVDRGRGGVWGYQINLGSMLRLDFLDPGTARRFDRVSGINHTYLFGEWQLTRLSNFGKKGSMNIGDSTWMVGLAMEF